MRHIMRPKIHRTSGVAGKKTFVSHIEAHAEPLIFRHLLIILAFSTI